MRLHSNRETVHVFGSFAEASNFYRQHNGSEPLQLSDQRGRSFEVRGQGEIWATGPGLSRDSRRQPVYNPSMRETHVGGADVQELERRLTCLQEELRNSRDSSLLQSALNGNSGSDWLVNGSLENQLIFTQPGEEKRLHVRSCMVDYFTAVDDQLRVEHDVPESWNLWMNSASARQLSPKLATDELERLQRERPELDIQTMSYHDWLLERRDAVMATIATLRPELERCEVEDEGIEESQGV